jgi:tetratricopeptide (TPR) repeat protein
MRYSKWLLIISLCFLGANWVDAQEKERLTKEEIQIQDDYLEAQVDIYMQRYEKAIPKLLKLFKANLNNAVIAFDLAKAYDKLEDFPNADKYASIAVREDSQNIWMQLFYARLMVKMQKFEEAAKTFSLLSKIDSEDYSHIENQAKALFNIGKGKEAVQILDKWEEENVVLEELIKLKFEYYKNKGEEKNAGKELEKLYLQDPFNVRYLNNLASFYKQIGKQKEARFYFEKVLEIEPDNTKANAAMYTLVKKDQKDGPYLRSLRPLIEKMDIDPDVKVQELIPYVLKVLEEQDPGNNPTAASLLDLTETLVLIHPNHAPSRAIRADVLDINNKKAEAILEYEKTLELDKKVYPVWEKLFVLLQEEKKFKSLADWAYLALDYFPNKAFNYLMYGCSQNELGDPSEGEDLLEEGLMIAANDNVLKSKIYTELSRSALLKNDPALAENHIDQALQLSGGKNAYAWEVKGDIKAFNGDQSAAQEFWNKAKQLGSTRSSLLKKLNQ